MTNLEEMKNIVAYHKSEKCFKCGIMVEKNKEGYFRCQCGFEWANLFIKRIPVDTYKIFKDYAEKEFCSDYGFSLKALLDNAFNSQIQAVFELMKGLDERISKLEQKPEKVIKMVNGKELIIGGRENE